MRVLWVVLAAIFTALTSTAIIGDLISEEIRARLGRLPYALIGLAARRVPLDVREDLAEEWTAELHEILRGAEAPPVTRLYRGTRYGLGLLRVAPSVGRDLSTSTATPRTVGDPVFPDLPGRVARQLLELAEVGTLAPGGRLRTRRTTQTELANMVGASRRSVSHALRTLEKHGYIRLLGWTVELVDPSELRRRAGW